ncbi:MAG: NYN domain-containing protein [Chloroherpetonaceae bacterium]|nr:NYN domain-containing protein [Chloroherpetonaceae bacterium]MDW8438301.1 NYN domain-containing protein [Chloroherpetonaceae bacterium]
MNRHFLIDGYNLAHKLGLKIDKNSLERARAEVQRAVSLYATRKNCKATIVYDGRWTLGSAEVQGNLEIVFTAQGETADARIKQMIDTFARRKSVCAVSSDNEILRYAEVSGVGAMTCEDFLLELNPPDHVGRPSQAQPESKPDKLDERELEEWMKVFGDDKPNAPQGDQQP